MAHVDALSRAVAYVNKIPIEREVELRQLTDPKIIDLCNQLEYKDNDKFALVNGLIYKKTATN